MNTLMSFHWLRVTRPTRLGTLALISLIAIGGCSNPGHRTSESATPTAPTGVVASTENGADVPPVIDRSGPGGGGGGGSNIAQDVTFPPRNEPFDFRLRLETQYQSVLRRSAVSSFVDIEGTIVWTQEYLRYRVNGCSHQDAIAKVTAQILGSGVQPICSDFTGTTVNFPPRDQPFAFRQELERLYRDVLRRGAVQTFVDTEGDIVWTQEYLRYRVNNCSHTEAVDRVLAQTLGAPVQPVCSPTGGGGGGGTSPGGGGSVTGFVSAVSSGGSPGVQQSTPRPNAGAGPIVGVSSAGAFSPGGTTQITLTVSSPIINVFVSANSTIGSTSLRPMAVTDTFFLITLPSPQTTIPVSVTLPGNVSGRFALEFGGSAPGGPVGNFAQLPVQIDAPVTCTYALLNGTTNFGAGGGQGSINVSVQPACGWTLSSNQSFLTPSVRSGTGSLQVGFTVASNSGPARTARLTLTGTNGGGAIFDVSQAAASVAPCSYSASANPTNFIPSGGGLSVTVTTAAGCGWSATSLDSFIIATGNTSGSGTGTVTFSVAANSSAAGRSGTVRVSFTATGGSQDLVINQSGQAAAAPVAVIVAPGTCAVDISCAFDATKSQNQITSWSWDFGDGTTGSGPMVSHIYPKSFVAGTEPGSRVATVRLTVTGPGGSNSASSNVTITRSY